MPEHPVISIDDDDKSVHEGLSDLFNAMGFVVVVVAFPRAVDFLKSKRLSDASCLIADVQTAGNDRDRALQPPARAGQRRFYHPDTAYPDDNDRERARLAGVICFLVTPIVHDGLLDCILATIEPSTQKGGSHERFDIGGSPTLFP